MSLGETIETILNKSWMFLQCNVISKERIKTHCSCQVYEIKNIYLNGKYVWNDFAFTNISFHVTYRKYGVFYIENPDA